ncbi:hypothetical protein CBS63078_6424 [Aspergillus niger]|nr:hypothetical protein CBS115989_9431 [Aspergillus niger]KAI2829203.1 hypothetical protein CBS133816_4740 [Aspergillus niger]KAI2837831.1 hypothetical protein CBS11350_8496 [Aspergillus niger]KAI2840644.1 hypothetical protein CBS11232_9025 [Aspergillus niger]KAI2852080.1 hypothetical protein CBS12448_8326 [Aspergillus niger]
MRYAKQAVQNLLTQNRKFSPSSYLLIRTRPARARESTSHWVLTGSPVALCDSSPSDHNLIAKSHEIMVVASLSVVVMDFVRHELIFGGGVPLGLISAGINFNRRSW